MSFRKKGVTAKVSPFFCLICKLRLEVTKIYKENFQTTIFQNPFKKNLKCIKSRRANGWGAIGGVAGKGASRKSRSFLCKLFSIHILENAEYYEDTIFN